MSMIHRSPDDGCMRPFGRNTDGSGRPPRSAAMACQAFSMKDVWRIRDSQAATGSFRLAAAPASAIRRR